MKRIMISYAIGIAIFWVVITLVGCGAQPRFHAVAHMNFILHVVSDDQMREEIARRGYPRQWSAFVCGNEAWVTGTLRDGKYIPDVVKLGHETWHQAGIMDPGFVNPDEVR